MPDKMMLNIGAIPYFFTPLTSKSDSASPVPWKAELGYEVSAVGMIIRLADKWRIYP